MTVSPKPNTTVTLSTKTPYELLIVIQRTIRSVHRVLRPVNQLNRQAPQPLQALIIHQLAPIAIQQAAQPAHRNQVVEAGHARAAQHAIELVVRGAVEPVVAPQPAKGELAAMTGHARAQLPAALRVEAQRLVQQVLDRAVRGRALAVEPVAARQVLVRLGQADGQRGFVPVDGAEVRVHEHVRGCDAADPVFVDGAVEEAHGCCDGAGAVCDDVDLVAVGTLPLADFFEGSDDVEAGVVGGVVAVGKGGFADAMRNTPASVASPGEAINGVLLDSTKGKDFMVYCGSGDEEDVANLFTFFKTTGRFPHEQG